LLANLSEALKPFFNRKQAHLKALVQPPPETFSEEEAKQLPPWYAGHSSYTKKQRAKSDAHQQARVERYRQQSMNYVRTGLNSRSLLIK
jgi:hypothetical protein